MQNLNPNTLRKAARHFSTEDHVLRVPGHTNHDWRGEVARMPSGRFRIRLREFLVDDKDNLPYDMTFRHPDQVVTLRYDRTGQMTAKSAIGKEWAGAGLGDIWTELDIPRCTKKLVQELMRKADNPTKQLSRPVK